MYLLKQKTAQMSPAEREARSAAYEAKQRKILEDEAKITQVIIQECARHGVYVMMKNGPCNGKICIETDQGFFVSEVALQALNVAQFEEEPDVRLCVKVHFDFKDGLKACAPSARWVPSKKAWVIDVEDIEEVILFAKTCLVDQNNPKFKKRHF